MTGVGLDELVVVVPGASFVAVAAGASVAVLSVVVPLSVGRTCSALVVHTVGPM